MLGVRTVAKIEPTRSSLVSKFYMHVCVVWEGCHLQCPKQFCFLYFLLAVGRIGFSMGAGTVNCCYNKGRSRLSRLV